MAPISPVRGSPAPWEDMEDSPRRTLVMRDKGKGVEKRKRQISNGRGPTASARRRTEEPESDDRGDDASDRYDPDQPMDDKRVIQQGFRSLQQELLLNQDEYLHPDSQGLLETLTRANALSKGIKQTTEATIDSGLLVKTANAAHRKSVKLVSGNAAQGIDVDEFVSKSLTFMRLAAGIDDDNAPELSTTQRQRRLPARASMRHDDESDEDNGGDPCNWEHLGKFACIPHIRRPPTPGFLLGPLSVQKKVRRIVRRTAPFRPQNLRETRPEVLDAEAVQRNEKNDLTGICSNILSRLRAAQGEAQDLAEGAYAQDGEAGAERSMAITGLRSTGGMDLFRFVINPKSFSQTVENLFYVSFLIRDGRIAIEFDENELPSLLAQADAEEGDGAAKHAAEKQQAVFSIDMPMWREIIDAFDIQESIIEHRRVQKSSGPGRRGWYT